MTFAVPSAVRVPVVALKLAGDPEPTLSAEPTLSVAGTVRAALSLPSMTVMPPLGADFDNVTVQVLLPLDPRLEGVQATEETSTGATRLIVVRAEEPL